MLPVLKQKGNLFDGFFEGFDEHFFDKLFDSGWRKDKDGNDVFEIEVPGFNKDNLKVELNNGVLTIEGKTDTRKIFKRYQININQKVEAKIKDGILSLILIAPKEQKSEKIEIK